MFTIAPVRRVLPIRIVLQEVKTHVFFFSIEKFKCRTNLTYTRTTRTHSRQEPTLAITRPLCTKINTSAEHKV